MNIDLYDLIMLQILGASTKECAPSEMNAYSVMINFNHYLSLWNGQAPTGLPYSRLRKLFKAGLLDHAQGVLPREKHRYLLTRLGLERYREELVAQPRRSAEALDQDLEKYLILIILNGDRSFAEKMALNIEQIINNPIKTESNLPELGANKDEILAIKSMRTERLGMAQRNLMNIKRLYLGAS